MRIGLIGYGEVGKIFGQALREAGVAQWVGAWDLNFVDATLADAQLNHARRAQISAAESLAWLCERSELLICAVTAASTRAAAEQAAQAIKADTVYLDLNSASPQTKTHCAELINAAGARYVEAGVMNSVPPYGIAVPMLIGGPHADDVLPRLTQFGMNAQIADQRYGVASAIKLCRSVMIKGLEAIVIESFTTARHYGVERQMLATLQETFPTIDWERQGRYFFSRVIAHGKRRAEEMREAADTVAAAGLAPTMAAAIADRQDSVARLRADGVFDALSADRDWRDAADLILRAIIAKRTRDTS